MKFKHWEPLEVPVWKSELEKWEGGEENGEDFVALMPGFHRGARLVGCCRLNLRSGALSPCLQRSPRRLFQRSLTGRPGQTGKEEEQEPE